VSVTRERGSKDVKKITTTTLANTRKNKKTYAFQIVNFDPHAHTYTHANIHAYIHMNAR